MDKKRKILRGEAKQEQILDAARQVFLEKGFDGASTDEIARRAKVSKATLYGLFPDKRALFVAFMERAVEANRLDLFEPPGAPLPLREGLTGFGTRLLTLLVSPDAMDLMRIAIAEGVRFPEFRRALYHFGQEAGAQRLAGFLRQATEAGEARVEDAELAAAQFIELCRADLFYRVLYGVTARPGAAEIARVVEAAVETFLARYGQ